MTDIVGSTPLWEAHSEVMSVSIARHDAIVAEVVEAYGGSLITWQGEGDSTLSSFARASDAVKAALALQRTMRREPWPHDTPIAIRLAMHTGEAQIRDGNYYGTTLNRTGRLKALSGAGQIVLSRATADIVAENLPPGAAIVNLGEIALKGLARAESVCALDHADLAEPPGPMPLLDGAIHFLGCDATP